MNISGNDVLREPRNLSIYIIKQDTRPVVSSHDLSSLASSLNPASPPYTHDFNTSCHGGKLTWIYGGQLQSTDRALYGMCHIYVVLL